MTGAESLSENLIAHMMVHGRMAIVLFAERRARVYVGLVVSTFYRANHCHPGQS